MWKTVDYTKKQINAAGRRICEGNLTAEQENECRQIIDNWRAAHAFPMNTFAVNLKRQVRDNQNAIVAQRLKRLDTIVGKLSRFPKMELYRMQDVGGCRVILNSIDEVYSLRKRIQDSRIRHEEHNSKDYIAIPNPSTGYRGLHVIYRYKSDKKSDYNGLQIEIQIRTKLQHLWATAVETVGVFTQNGLKFNQGSERWLRFFKVASALFSVEEKSAIVEGVSNNPSEITQELKGIIDELGVYDKFLTIGLAAREFGRVSHGKTAGYYLLVLDIDKMVLAIKAFTGVEKSLEEATAAYNRIEAEKGSRSIDAVLVSAQSFDLLAAAYPNYFADITEFSSTLRRLVDKYSKG